jgi:PAS domain S-box-containing protein
LRFKRDQSRLMEQAVKEQTLEMVRTKHFLNGILDSSTLVSVVLTDTNQQVRFWNKGAENIFGYTAQEMLGNKITKLYPPDGLTKEMVEELRALVANKAGTIHAKMKQVAKDGRLLTISLALTPMIDGAGEFQGILGMGLDVTEEVQRNREVLKLLQKVKQTQDVTILTLVRLAEDREGESGSKLIRIQEYCRALADALAKKPDFEATLTKRYIDDLVRSAVLYDVGKVALSDSVLLCPGDLSPHEREEMRRHPLYGGKALQEAVKKLGPESFLTLGMEMAFYHHEHWDGSGYPFGLKDQEIPLSARIVAIADVYDALTSERRYRRAFSHEEAYTLMVDLKGKQFDPAVVDEFQALQVEFQMIRKVYAE